MTEVVKIVKTVRQVVKVVAQGPAGAPGDTVTLQKATDNGNQTTNDIILSDSGVIIRDAEGNQIGKLSQALDPDYGLILRAETADNARDSRLTMTGSNILLGTEQLEAVFNGAEDGNTLIIKGKKDVQGNDVFVISSVPRDADEFAQSYSSTADVALTASYQTAVNGLASFDYRPNTSYGDGSLYIENAGNADLDVEVGLAIGANTPSQTATFTIPRKRGGVNGFRRISTHDTFTSDISVGDDIHLRVRDPLATGDMSILGSVEASKLDLVQTANLRNSVQASRTLTPPGPSASLESSLTYDISSGEVFFLPQAILNWNPDRPVDIEVKNTSGKSIIIDSSGADSIYTARGPVNFFDISDGESFTFRCNGEFSWKVTSAYQNDESKRLQALGASSTNAQFSVNPATIISQNISLGYARAKFTVSFESSNSATNRSTVLALYIDGVMVDQPCTIEPKDNRDIYWPGKVFDYLLAPGNHLVEVKIGKGYGGGGSIASVSNVRIFIEEVRL